MMRVAMSPAAAALIRALADRTGLARNRTLLTHVRSTDWRSLTLDGERHELALRISGAGAAAAAQRLCTDLEEAEFTLPGAILADIDVRAMRGLGGPDIDIDIEALTIAE